MVFIEDSDYLPPEPTPKPEAAPSEPKRKRGRPRKDASAAPTAPNARPMCPGSFAAGTAGECPECGRTYALTGAGLIRKHAPKAAAKPKPLRGLPEAISPLVARGFGVWLRSEREARGMTAKDAAAEMGMHAVSLSLFETGKKHPGIATVTRIAAWAAANFDDIVALWARSRR